MFISPKRKKTVLEMVLKSFILSKLDHEMSKSWKEIVAHELETTSKFDLLKNWVLDCSAQDSISAKSFQTQNMSSRCSSSPVEKKIKKNITSLCACGTQNSPLNKHGKPCRLFQSFFNLVNLGMFLTVFPVWK